MGGMFGRIADVWRPLYAVADAAGGDWPELTRRAALSLTSQTNAIAPGESLGVQLLRDCRLVFEEHGSPDYLPTSDLDRALFAMGERPWKTLSNGNAMTVQRRGNLLGQYGIKTDKVRHDGKPTNIYWRSAFKPEWKA